MLEHNEGEAQEMILMKRDSGLGGIPRIRKALNSSQFVFYSKEILYRTCY